MKSFSLVVLALLLVAGTVTAQHSGCPAHHVAELGHSPFDAFHEVMAAAWHKAYPDKDYDALIEAGPKFDKTFAAITEMKPGIKLKSRHDNFLLARDLFGQLVKKYVAAAKNGDTEAVYELMPKLHDAFEETAFTLLPTEYKELEGLAVVSEMIVNTHLPEKNEEGIVGSTETLMKKVGSLTEESIPEGLESVKKNLLGEFSELKKIADEMKTNCDNKEMENYKKLAVTFHNRLSAMMTNYL